MKHVVYSYKDIMHLKVWTRLTDTFSFLSNEWIQELHIFMKITVL